jgi:putative ATP-dependent endonuclease of the OLD family
VRIDEIRWTNYRRLADARLSVRGHLVLLGPNDSGKSSVLRAIHLCLGVPGTQLSSSVQPRDLTSPDQPLVLEVVLGDISEDDRAAFPDEIEVGPPETLTIRVEAHVDPDDPTVVTVERAFPFAGHRRGVSRLQLQAIGWHFVAATRSMIRELGTGSGGTARELLMDLDLTDDEVTFNELAERYRAALDGSSVIGAFRSSLADALTDALPHAVHADDVGVSPATELSNSPLAGAAVTISDGEHVAPIAEQSDGVRALTVLALVGMANKAARIVGIDEPETHLYPSAQRAVAESLQRSEHQRIVATHSSAVVGRMSPLDIVAFGADRRARQLDVDAPIATVEVSTRHWGHRMIEPLTATRIVVLEGPSDRIVCARAAELAGYNLDRAGITLFELDGAEMFPTANRIFGTPGFDLPLCGLVDSDAADKWAKELGIDRTALEASNIIECVPDLEGAYVDALGVDRTVELLTATGFYTEQAIVRGCGVAMRAALTTDALADFCRHKRRKIPAALAISGGMTQADAS